MMKASATKTTQGRYKPTVINTLAEWGRRSQLMRGAYLTREEAVTVAQAHIDRLAAEAAAWKAKATGNVIASTGT